MDIEQIIGMVYDGMACWLMGPMICFSDGLVYN
jgi:hypothetical protein